MNKPSITYSEKLQTMSDLAGHFQCAKSTLRTWVKKGDLPSYQETSKQPHLLNPEHVERRLRNSAHVKSIFHPNPKKLSPSSPSKDSLPAIMKAAHALTPEQQHVLISSLGGLISSTEPSGQ